MQNIIDFINSEEIESTKIFKQLKCSKDEATILQYMLKKYILGDDILVILDILSNFYDIKKFEHLKHLSLIKSLLEFGWVVQSNFNHLKLSETSQLELLNSSISLSSTFLKLVEGGFVEFVLPEIKQYGDHLEYLQDQFLKISLVQKINISKHNLDASSPNINRLKSKLTLLENRINERVKSTKDELMLEGFFREQTLSKEEQTLFLALLKEEYSGGDESIRDMNTLIELISSDDYEKIKHRSLLEESSKLVSSGLVDYDEVLTPFGGINRNFYIPDEILYKISHPTKKKSSKDRIKLDMLIKEQDMFELISSNKSLDDVVLHPKTKETLQELLKQVDKNVIARLKQWGIKDKKKGIDARIIFYGVAGTGKTLTSLALAKSLKKDVLSFDCSKILSMYVGESEKNVRAIFDKYYELKQKSKSEPVLLLNEADQFLGARTKDTLSGSEKMHNQMQNIFLEQIERFDGILIATTNLLENIDKAFSRRFNYKIEFIKPNENQRIELWEKLLPQNLPLENNFQIEKLSNYDITGGQIELIIKNAAYKVATKEKQIFTTDIFIEEIEKEIRTQFDKENKMGFK